MYKEIIFITGKDPCGDASGHSSFVRSTARGAIRLGFTPRIFCAARRSGLTVTDFGVVHKTASPLRSFRQTTVPLHAPMIAADVMRYLSAKEGPHLIHSISTWGCAGVIAGRELRRRGHQVTTIVNAYTTMEHEAAGKLRGLTPAHGELQRLQNWAEYAWFKLIASYERRAYLESDLVMVNYESVRRLLIEKYGAGLKIHKLTYAPESAFSQSPWDGGTERRRDGETEGQGDRGMMGFNLSVSPSLRPSVPPSPLIVSVSRHDPRKGVDALLLALAEMRKRGAGFRALVLSGGPLLSAHRRLAEQLELGESTVLTGWVPDPFPYLRHADIFVLPSLEEGSGSVSMLEAMQAGVAIVASNVDGLPEDVTDGESALLVEPGNVDQLSRALARLLTDSELSWRLRRRARETFAERFSAEAFSDALRMTYAELGFRIAE